CFNIIKEVCKKPPKLINVDNKTELKCELLYMLLDYFIILDEKELFEKTFNNILRHAESSHISYKFYVLLKKFSIKYFNQIYVVPAKEKSIKTAEQNLISEFIEANCDYIQVSNNVGLVYYPFRKFIEVSISSLKTNIKEEVKN